MNMQLRRHQHLYMGRSDVAGKDTLAVHDCMRMHVCAAYGMSMHVCAAEEASARVPEEV